MSIQTGQIKGGEKRGSWKPVFRWSQKGADKSNAAGNLDRKERSHRASIWTNFLQGGTGYSKWIRPSTILEARPKA